MKLLLISSSLLLTLLFSLTSNAAVSDTVVYDTDGHALIPEKPYYILPVIRGRGGGLTVTQHNRMCPLYVAQENFEVKRGRPLIFRPANQKDTVIHLSTDINILFAITTSCVQATGWRLGNAEEADNKRHVTLGAFSGNPGQGTVSNWFKIEKWGTKGYKLVFCPSVCNTCKVVCGDLGVFNEGGKKLLGLNGNPFPVMFKRTDSGN